MVLEKIRNEFEQRSKKNPAYSLRAFARSLGMNSSTLSSLLNGKRKLTFKTAQKLLDKFEMTAIERKEILFGTYQPSLDSKYKFIEDDYLEIVAGWEHYAILSLLEVDSFQTTKTNAVKYISTQLNIPSGQVIAALARLEKVELIKKVKGHYQLCQTAVATSQDIPSAALKKAHREYIEKALYALENHPVLERDITGITMAINKSKLPEAKKLIQNFRKSLSELLETGKKEEVYRLNIQLFSLKK